MNMSPQATTAAQKVPLVVGNHGGLMTGWGHAIYTSWTLVADREGFICVFPDAHPADVAVEGIVAMTNTPTYLPVTACDPDDYHENHDLNFLKALIAQMQEKYKIDAGRVFMQGMSMGNLMTEQFARYYGNVLGGRGRLRRRLRSWTRCLRGRRDRNRGGPLPIWQSRAGETNGRLREAHYDEPALNRFDRFYWMTGERVRSRTPQIRIVGEHNFAFYKGEKADLVYLDIKNRDHGQTLDEAFLYWDYLFSGLRRDAGRHRGESETILPRVGDAFAMALTDRHRQGVVCNTVAADAVRARTVAKAEVPRTGRRTE